MNANNPITEPEQVMCHKVYVIFASTEYPSVPRCIFGEYYISTLPIKLEV